MENFRSRRKGGACQVTTLGVSVIEILIVDDHQIFRSSLRALLSSFEGIRIVGEAANGQDAIEVVKAQHVDLVLMDISMPGMDGIEATRVICDQYPGVHVLMLTFHCEQDCLLQALRAGAQGYLTKDVTLPELEEAIHAVMAGEVFLSRVVSRSLVNYVRSDNPEAHASPLLTPRQHEVLKMIGEGSSTQHIAQTLEIDVKTVDAHRSQIMKRLNIEDQAGLVRFAVVQGLARESQKFPFGL